MSHYADFIKEREDKDIIEDKFGYATYKYFNDGIYLEDVYVVPKERKNGKAASYADIVASIGKEKGFNKMFTTVSPLDKNATRNLKVVLGYGFTLLNSTPSLIWFTKEI